MCMSYAHRDYRDTVIEHRQSAKGDKLNRYRLINGSDSISRCFTPPSVGLISGRARNGRAIRHDWNSNSHHLCNAQY